MMRDPFTKVYIAKDDLVTEICRLVNLKKFDVSKNVIDSKIFLFQLGHTCKNLLVLLEILL